MLPEQPERHEMRLERTESSGEEEWYCPTCGRRFLMQWPPEYKRTILEAGDESAIHAGGKNMPGLGLDLEITDPGPETSAIYDPADLNPFGADAPIDEVISEDELSLQPWLDWMEESNFDSRWG